MTDKKNNLISLVLVVGIVGALIFLLLEGVNLDFWKQKISRFTGKSETQLQMTPFPFKQEGVNLPKIPSDTEQRIEEKGSTPGTFNEKGVELVLKQKLWEGMFYFDKAIRENPSDMVSLANMIVVLSEMGLSKPAERYISMLRKLNPKHPLLQSLSSGKMSNRY